MFGNKTGKLFLIFLTISTIVIISFTLLMSNSLAPEHPATDLIKPVPHLDAFGLPTDSLNILNGVVVPNETITSILNNAGVPDSSILNLHEFNEIYNFKKIGAGKRFRFYTSKNNLNKVMFFVYEKTPVDFIVVDFTDSLSVYQGKRKIKTRIREVSGIINYSLYTALERNAADPELFVKLSTIFAWQIDFYHIQKGDNFKVVYEEQYIGNKSIGISKIIGAFFNHMGENYYAVDFKKNGSDEYFDENGKSLRKAFLKAPLEYSRISSRYSLRRFHPILKRFKSHLGTDYAAPKGTPIRSVGEGVIIAATYSRGNGNYVKIRHNSVYTTQYLHMSKFAKGIRKGKTVKQGQIIGYVGSTGLATGPHLCYRFWKNGIQVDPLKEKLPPSKPIDNKYINEYNVIRDSVISKLNQIKFNDSENSIIASGN